MAKTKQTKKKTKKRSKGMRAMENILLVLCIAVFLLSGALLLKQELDYSAGANSYSSLIGQAMGGQAPEMETTATSFWDRVKETVNGFLHPQGNNPTENDPLQSGASDAPTAPQVTPVPQLSAVDLENLSINFDWLKLQNPDTVAWLYGPGTMVNYPVTQGTDNDYYIDHLFDGQENSAGCLFLDYTLAPDFSGYNNIIYGHNMKNGSMFATFVHYKQQSFYDQHPSLYLITPTGKYRIDLFAGVVSDVYANCWQMHFDSEQAVVDWANDQKAKSTFASDVTLAPGDKVVSFSTCTYEFDNARYVVFGKMVPLS